MPRYIVQRTFPGGPGVPLGPAGAERRAAVLARNAREGVTWITSYVSEDQRSTFCVYDAPTPEAIRMSAASNQLPIDAITRVSVLDPHSYQ
jgi:hypothetical protein